MSIVEFSANKTSEYDDGSVAFEPPWVNGVKSKEAFLKWFTDHLPRMENFSREFIEDAWANLFWYTGDYLPHTSLSITSQDGKTVEIPRQLTPFTISLLANLTDKRASDLSIYKPNHEVKPEDDSEGDRLRARLMKPMIENVKRFNEAERLFDLAEKWNMVFGCVYAFVDFNPKIGDRKIADASDKKKKAKIEWEGEVTIKLQDPWKVLPWPSRSWETCPGIVEIHEILHVEEARKKYNDPAIMPFGESELYNFTSFTSERVRVDETVIYRVIFAPSEYMENGLVALVANKGKHLISMETENYPWSHRRLPCVRYTDIDIPGRHFPMSFYQHVKPLQHAYNNVAALLKRYVYTVAHPKWTMVRGSCNIKSLGNVASVIQHKLGQAPTLQTIKPIGSDPFNFLNILEEKMIRLSNSHQIGMGNLPPNTRSGIMISRLREIEAAQRGPQIDKRNGFMQDVLLLAASNIRDHYPLQSENRLARIVGKAMVPEVKKLTELSVIARDRIEIVNPTGFSQEMAGRLEEIAFINQQVDPTLLTRQQKLDILGIDSKHYDAATAALRAAESENENMSNGVGVDAPAEWEDHLQHWPAHMIDLQSPAFKSLPKKIQVMKIDHIRATEEFMWDLAFDERGQPKNPTLIQQYMTLNGFPRFFVPEKPPAPSPQEQAAMQQQQMAAAAAEQEKPKSNGDGPRIKRITINGPNGVTEGQIVEEPLQ